MVMRSALINVMAKAADKAAKSLRHDFGEIEQLQVSRKGPGDFVSNADYQAQKIIREELSRARPAFGFLAEENDGTPDSSGNDELWVIDPIDGTANFLHGNPHFCISIGAMRGGEAIAGYIYNPLTAECFWAEKGLGAFQDDQRLRVSVRKELSECLIGSHLPLKGKQASLPAALAALKVLMGEGADVRMTGSAALSLAYVAAGRFDAFFQSGLGPWDSAAGAIIVKEAGGFVSPVNPKENAVLSGAIIATNSNIHDKLVQIVRSSAVA